MQERTEAYAIVKAICKVQLPTQEEMHLIHHQHFVQTNVIDRLKELERKAIDIKKKFGKYK